MMYGILLTANLFGVVFEGTFEPFTNSQLILLAITAPVVLVFLLVFSLAIFVWNPRMRRGRQLYDEYSPHLLASKKFTTVDRPFIVVDEFGIEGWFALSWERVYAIQLLDQNRLLISYRRRPQWLASLLRANSFILVVHDNEKVAKIMDLWQSSQTN